MRHFRPKRFADQFLSLNGYKKECMCRYSWNTYLQKHQDSTSCSTWVNIQVFVIHDEIRWTGYASYQIQNSKQRYEVALEIEQYDGCISNDAKYGTDTHENGTAQYNIRKSVKILKLVQCVVVHPPQVSLSCLKYNCCSLLIQIISFSLLR